MIRDAMIKARRMLGSTCAWLGSNRPKQAPRDFAPVSKQSTGGWKEILAKEFMGQSVVPANLFRLWNLVEYCFGPVPEDRSAFDCLWERVQSTVTDTLHGLLTRDLVIEEETTEGAFGHVFMMGPYRGNMHVRFKGPGWSAHRTLVTIIHEGTHKFAGTEETLGSRDSYIEMNWNQFWITRSDQEVRFPFEEASGGLNSPCIVSRFRDNELGLSNADSIATFVVHLFE
jgi:hypothetical protein